MNWLRILFELTTCPSSVVYDRKYIEYRWRFLFTSFSYTVSKVASFEIQSWNPFSMERCNPDRHIVRNSKWLKNMFISIDEQIIFTYFKETIQSNHWSRIIRFENHQRYDWWIVLELKKIEISENYLRRIDHKDYSKNEYIFKGENTIR